MKIKVCDSRCGEVWQQIDLSFVATNSCVKYSIAEFGSVPVALIIFYYTNPLFASIYIPGFVSLF